MTIFKKTLQDAAFWHRSVCLDCGVVQEDEGAVGTPCEECDSDEVFPAEHILKCVALVRDEE